MIAIQDGKSISTIGTVDSHLDKLGTSRGAGCLRRAYRGIYRGRPSVFFALFLFMLIAGVGTGAGNPFDLFRAGWSDTTHWATSVGMRILV